MTGLNAPDSISPLKYLAISWSSLGMGNMTLLTGRSGVMSAKIGFWDSGPKSEER